MAPKTTQEQSGSAANNGDNKYTTSITTSNDNANSVLNPHALFLCVVTR